MSRKTDTVVARTIGIDTGKNTLHLIGLDDRGAIVLREKLTRGRIAARLANVRSAHPKASCQQGSAISKFSIYHDVKFFVLKNKRRTLSAVRAKQFVSDCEATNQA
jgi:hypothetical protein